MASVGGGNPFQGGKRTLDAEINLVPFIDLLSMCICFLLMTAIWVEIGSVQIRQILGTDAAPITTEALDLQVRFKADKTMDVQLEKGGRPIQTLSIEPEDGHLRLTRLSNFVATLMGALAGQNGGADITARVVPISQVNYAELVSVLDVLKGFGVSQLAVVPVKE